MNADQQRCQRIQAWACVAVLPLLGVLAWWRPLPAPSAPPRIPASAAEPWMADCLPGVGPKTRERMALAIREGRFDVLPRRARDELPCLFDLER